MIRVIYLMLAAAVDLTVLYVDLFPGTTRDERFERGMFGMLMLPVSLILSIPVFLYVFWKLVNHEKRPMFWGIALVVATLPIIMMFVYFFYDLWFASRT
jgi:hypothetical protein